jgi:UPF0716 protein FxsA
MPLLLLVAFIVVPLVELFVIAQVADGIGLGPTLVLLIVDSVVGAWLVRNEGRRAWQAFRDALADGRWPGDEVAQGALVLVGGALLLTPGFVTDVAGLLMLLPPTRRALARTIRTRMTGPVRVVDGLGGRWNQARQADPSARRQGDDGVVDVEVVRVERDEPEPPDELAEGG